MSTQLTQHYFLHFQEQHETMSTRTQTWHSWRAAKNLQKKNEMGPRKKFWDLQAWLGVLGPWLGVRGQVRPRPDFQVRPKTLKIIQNGFRIDSLG